MVTLFFVFKEPPYYFPQWLLYGYTLLGIFLVCLLSATFSLWHFHVVLYNSFCTGFLNIWYMQLGGQKYPCLSSLPLHFLLILKYSITSPTRHLISPPAHNDFPTVWITIPCDFLIYNFNKNVLLSDWYWTASGMYFLFFQAASIGEENIVFFIDLVYYLASSTQQNIEKSSNKCLLHWIDVSFLEIRTCWACWLNGILSNKLESWI